MNPIKQWMIQRGVQENHIANLDRATIEQNEQRSVTFDYSDVRPLDAYQVIRDQVDASQLPVIGAIAMPELKMNLPIIKGAAPENMYLGAGTLDPNQKMGKGNYPLASHYSIQEGMLFQPLLNAKIGQTIYLTDLSKVYEYKVTVVEHVDPYQIQWIQPTQEAYVTLVTCDYGLNNRVIVRGAFQKDYDIKQVNQEVLDAFEIDQTLPD